MCLLGIVLITEVINAYILPLIDFLLPVMFYLMKIVFHLVKLHCLHHLLHLPALLLPSI